MSIHKISYNLNYIYLEIMLTRVKTFPLVFIFYLLAFISCNNPDNVIFLEAENFADRGGWVVDQQSMDVMGSPYLLAHGLGIPVKDAETIIRPVSKGNYHVWLRTRNWTASWDVEETPGIFLLLINNEPLDTIFGKSGVEWGWKYGGNISLETKDYKISLKDLTGFAGRCDAVLFTKNRHFTPPADDRELYNFRKKHLGLPSKPENAGEYDLVVVGGGMAGCCAAVSAARLGCKVALIQNRPVLGGNNSSEVRVGLSGKIHQEPYPKLGNLVDEIGSVGYHNYYEALSDPDSPRSQYILDVIAKNPEKLTHNAGPASNYGDDKKLEVIENEPNIQLFLNIHVFRAETKNSQITSVTGKNIYSGKEYIFKGKLFADCTGDGNLGYLAGADFNMGPETKSETGEPSAPEHKDKLTMGISVQWYATEGPEVSDFPSCPWAVQFNENTCYKMTRGDWDWEAGMHRDQVTEVEFIRDYALRVTFGNWDFIKNKSVDKEKFSNQSLTWVAYIGGKRESRRLIGDVLLKEQDIVNEVPYEDGSFTTTWSIDLHYPVKADNFDGEPFRARSKSVKIKPYPVPYRCLYSRNINNLFMAGRNISVSRIALGTIRVMRTGGMMGEVVGMAASICNSNNCLPRDIYKSHLNELKNLMTEGVPSKK